MPKETERLYAVIAACHTVSSNVSPIFDLFEKNETDALLSFSAFHGILPLLYQHVKHFYPDTPLCRTLKEHYRYIVHRNMQLASKLIALHRVSSSLGISPLYIKGAVLAQLAYGDITLRRFGDIDLFIRKEDFDALASWLISEGFEPYFDIRRYKGNVLFELNNDIPFYHKQKGIAVEVHWDFFKKLALPTRKLEPWKDTTTVTINRTPIPTLKHETHLLYHSLHGSKHLWERLLWIVDIDRFIRAVPNLDWDEILTKASALKAKRMFLLGPALAHRYFDTPLPKRILQEIQTARLEPFMHIVENILKSPDAHTLNSLDKLRFILKLKDTPVAKIKTLFEFLFKPGINERRMIVLPEKLFWLYWVVRPFGAAYRFVSCRLFNRCNESGA